ncbi:MAG: NUDIX hydrolase [Bacteroidota bacterium]
MIKIYYKKRLISLSLDKLNHHNADIQSVNISEISDIKVKINRFITNREIKHLNIYGTDPKRTLAFIKHAYRVIIAGGGLVNNKEDMYLFIVRHKKIDLPKGKAENGESPEACALREVSEECNMVRHNLTITGKLGITYHMYKQKGEMVLKENHWFNMLYTGNNSCIQPQIEEDIEKCMWIDKNEIPALVQNTYPSVRDLVYEHKT